MQNRDIQVRTIAHYQYDPKRYFQKIFTKKRPKSLTEAAANLVEGRLEIFKTPTVVKGRNSKNEEFLESLIQYVRENYWPDRKKAQFMTTRKVLKSIAGNRYQKLTIVAFKYQGIIHIVEKNEDCGLSFEQSTKRFFTEISENAAEKCVFLATIPIACGGSFRVMYYDEIDAIDESENHVEIESFTTRPNLVNNGIPVDFWKNRSANVYWSAVFGNVKTIVISLNAKDQQETSLRAVQKESIDSFLAKSQQYNPQMIKEGKRRLEKFLADIHNRLLETDKLALLKMVGKEDLVVTENFSVEFQKLRDATAPDRTWWYVSIGAIGMAVFIQTLYKLVV